MVGTASEIVTMMSILKMKGLIYYTRDRQQSKRSQNDSQTHGKK